MAAVSGHSSTFVRSRLQRSGSGPDQGITLVHAVDDVRHTGLHEQRFWLELGSAAVGSLHGIKSVLADVKAHAVFYQAGDPRLVWAVSVHQPHALAECHDLDIDHVGAAVVLDQVIGRIEDHGFIGLVAKLQDDVLLRKGFELFARYLGSRNHLAHNSHQGKQQAQQYVSEGFHVQLIGPE